MVPAFDAAFRCRGAVTALVAGCTQGTGEGEDVPEEDEREEGIDEIAEDADPPGEPDDWEGVETIGSIGVRVRPRRDPLSQSEVRAAGRTGL